jgi:hypothetical protein
MHLKTFKKIVLLFVLVASFCVVAKGQTLNNSWIDYNKTYYKFKVWKDELVRIPQSLLAGIGLSGTPGSHFQLWRNGQEVPLHVSSGASVLTATDFIEFWGNRNDGKPDQELFLAPEYQLNQKFSLETDTAIYYLTTNSIGNNKRFIQTTNPVAGTTVPVEPYFMRVVDYNIRDGLHLGYGAYLGEIVYSSAYDKGEGVISYRGNAISTSGFTFGNLHVNTAATNESVTFTNAACGASLHARIIATTMNSIPIDSTPLPFYEFFFDTVRNIPLSTLLARDGGNSVELSVSTISGDMNDRYLGGHLSVTYPANFNFVNSTTFKFSLRGSNQNRHLKIVNFNHGGTAPILYDITTGRRFLGDIATTDTVRFVLPSYADTRDFVLLNQTASNVRTLAAVTQKNFVNYNLQSNQGDYLIVSHPNLFNDGTGKNQVDEYKNYRASVAGGSYNPKVYDINELTEQFAFGIVRHPAAVRDFVRFAQRTFTAKPKFIFLIGRGVSYEVMNEINGVSNALGKDLNLIPPFGHPASDILMVSEPGQLIPIIPVGRLGAITGKEVEIYLNKVKTYEAGLKSPIQNIASKNWMKDVLLTAGGSDSYETADFLEYLNVYKRNYEDACFAGKTAIYAKTSVTAIEQAQNLAIETLINNGVGLVEYFGHSSANDMAIGVLNNPERFRNNGKYPLFHVSGCTVGNYYTARQERLLGYNGMTVSERYIFAPSLGSVGFLAGTHWGIAPFLHYYNTNFSANLSKIQYGKSIGEHVQQTIRNIGSSPGTIDYYTRLHAEEINLHGDPALVFGGFTKPDFVIEEPQVKISPTVVTVASGNFTVDALFKNIGKFCDANDTVRVTIKHLVPNGEVRILYDQKIPNLLYEHAINMNIQIRPFSDKGLNKLIFTIDDGDKVSELEEMNNTLTKEFFIFEDELQPIQPYKYAILNNQNVTFYANTSNPLSSARQYLLEVDTTMEFNSAIKRSSNTSGIGGLIEFVKPAGLNLMDSTVYYWRVAVAPRSGESPIWNNSSFVYLANSTPGFNQSNYFQFKNNEFDKIELRNNRNFYYLPRTTNYLIKTTIYPSGSNQLPDFMLSKEGVNLQGGIYAPVNTANNDVVRIFVIDSVSGNPWMNTIDPVTGLGQYGSVAPILGANQPTGWYQFKVTTTADRLNVLKFLDSIPIGNTIVVTNTIYGGATNLPKQWRGDTATFGSGVSLYHKLKGYGFTALDSAIYDSWLPYVFIHKKGSTSSNQQGFGTIRAQRINLPFTVVSPNLTGSYTSEKFGPAAQWQELHWRGYNLENNGNDKTAVDIIGVSNNGTETYLRTVFTALDTTLGFINAQTYPYLKLRMKTSDSAKGTPIQLRYWRINARPVAEGAIAPNILYALADSVDQGAPIELKLAFKNISTVSFDSTMKFKLTVTDKSNNRTEIAVPRGKVLVAGDTLVVKASINSANFAGTNSLYLDVNPDNHQAEQTHINNILFKDFFVKADVFNPTLDVTFDGIHILNKDIVSAKPNIVISLKDENRFMALADTGLLKVYLRSPDGNEHPLFFSNVLQFVPANVNNGNSANNAIINYRPYFTEDGEYELIVSGNDVVGNKAGNLQYKIAFNVVNKEAISNVLNYPNPFTTSTSFVFTITGSEVPQNIRIQILTITGKIVREITKQELGQLRVGKNITDFKWDGTDSYGAKLANGVYLYRVITNNNGKALDKFKYENEKTDQYFKGGYGKLVIIR